MKGFIKGMAAGLAVGMAAGFLIAPLTDRNMRCFKKSAKAAMKAMENLAADCGLRAAE